MSITEDFDPTTAQSLRAELEQFGDCCRYDESAHKVIYRSGDDALNAYLVIQQQEMERHKWLESEKAQQDLDQAAVADWILKHSPAFAKFWHRTHVYVPSNRDGQQGNRPQA